jgi:hypothetical protein
VNQDLGAYNLKPQYVKLLQGIGANFPQWHDYIALTAAGRALIRNPGRVERLARGEQNANDTFLKGKPYRVTMAGPNVELASALADPVRRGAARYPSYFGGPSSLGPLSGVLNPKASAEEYAAGMVPFGTNLLDYFANPFKSTMPKSARAALGLAGIYAQNKPKKKHRVSSPRP